MNTSINFNEAKASARALQMMARSAVMSGINNGTVENVDRYNKTISEALDHAQRVLAKLKQIKEVIDNSGLGHGADLEAYYKITSLIMEGK